VFTHRAVHVEQAGIFNPLDMIDLPWV
jgi:hypothetical protein